MILVDSHPRQDWLLKALEKRLREELARLKVEINEETSRMVNLSKGESFSFLGLSIAASAVSGTVVAPVCASAEEADGVASEAEASLPTVLEPACGTGYRNDQSDSARMGVLLCARGL